MNINQQIAKIDGWTRVNENPMISDGLCGIPRTGAPQGKYYAIPDYLAPENRHELERIAENVCLTYRHIWNDGHRYVLFAHGLTVGEGHSDKQSYALAKAIVEAKG